MVLSWEGGREGGRGGGRKYKWGKGREGGREGGRGEAAYIERDIPVSGSSPRRR